MFKWHIKCKLEFKSNVNMKSYNFHQITRTQNKTQILNHTHKKENAQIQNHTHKNQMCNSKIIKKNKIAHKILTNIENQKNKQKNSTIVKGVGGILQNWVGWKAWEKRKPHSPTKKQKKSPKFTMYIPKYYYESKIHSRINHTIHIVKRFLESKRPLKRNSRKKKKNKRKIDGGKKQQHAWRVYSYCLKQKNCCKSPKTNNAHNTQTK